MDFYPIKGKPHCYTCRQWDGFRTYEPQVKMWKTDPKLKGHCRVHHDERGGEQTCIFFVRQNP